MAQFSPYEIQVPDSALKTLHQKLELATFPDELNGAEWDYGSPLSDIKRITEYWRTKFDWRAAEAKLNALPNFETTLEIDNFGALDVHFVHQRSKVENAVPLLFVHGWPGSYIEVIKLLPLLTQLEKNGGPAFHVVAPSLPNFGFSARVTKTGFGLGQYTEVCHKLMLKLGYEQYVSQGGDWGSFITRLMAKRYPQSLKAIHLNMVAQGPPPISSPLAFIRFLATYALGLYSPIETEGLKKAKDFQKTGMGYYQQQTTKPQTLGYSLADSPVGLLAWIYEKLHDWTDSYPWTDDEICTWVSIYWFSRAGPAASVRIYYESLRGEFASEKIAGWIPDVKIGLAYFPRELVRLPMTWGRQMGNVVYEKEWDRGGHFAAWEVPELIVEDLVGMFAKGGKAFGVVEGRSGFD